MTNEKLKPCPFCGGEAHATPAHGPTRMAERVACLVCAAELSGTGAIEQWQARAALPVREAVADGWRPVPITSLERIIRLIDPEPLRLPNGDNMVFKNPNAAVVLREISAEVRAMLAAATSPSREGSDGRQN